MIDHQPLPNADLSITDQDYLTNLNSIKRESNAFLTNRYLGKTEPLEFSISPLVLSIPPPFFANHRPSFIYCPSIFCLDAGVPFSSLIETNPNFDQMVYVSNINAKTKKLDLYCSICPFTTGQQDVYVISKRMGLSNSVYESSKFLVDGVAPDQKDHYNGFWFHKAFGTEYNEGPCVILPENINKYFTIGR